MWFGSLQVPAGGGRLWVVGARDHDAGPQLLAAAGGRDRPGDDAGCGAGPPEEEAL